MGGPAEHHFRKVRPAAEQLPWGTLDASRFSPAAVERARSSWTEVAINEYRAIAAFAEVLRALVDVRAPLDLLGMTSDFLADECSHVELASRMAMELGGAAPREVDPERFAFRSRAETPLQRANDILLRVSCISEALAGGTAAVSCAHTSHELPRSVYETILRDESLHRRLGGLYFEWALPRCDDAELERLGRVLAQTLEFRKPSWKGIAAPPPSAASATESPSSRPAVTPVEPDAGELAALGWLQRSHFARVAREVVVRDIIEPLATIGITLTPEEREAIL